MTTAKVTKTSFNGKEVRYILADLDCVTVEKISGSVLNSGKYGINGTFFNASTTNLLGVAVNNGVAVKTGGDQTGDAPAGPTKRGVMYHFSPKVGGLSINNAVVKNFLDYSGSTT